MKLLQFISNLFHSKLKILNKIKYYSPINRVKHLTELNGFDKCEVYYSIYGIISIHNKIHAIAHWQGWEDAGWKIIPVKDLEPFRLPRLSEVEFYYTYPTDIHHWDHSLGGNKCKIKEFVLVNNEYVNAIIKFDNGDYNQIPLEYLYDVNDPQFYD